jgi:hypothetical protein
MGRHTVCLAFAAVCILMLAACENRQPAARAGEALDRTGSRTGDALGRAANSTGAAIGRAGDWVRDRTQ